MFRIKKKTSTNLADTTFKLKMATLSYENVKVICQVTLFNKMLFIVDLEVAKMFYASTMLELDHDHGIRF